MFSKVNKFPSHFLLYIVNKSFKKLLTSNININSTYVQCPQFFAIAFKCLPPKSIQ